MAKGRRKLTQKYRQPRKGTKGRPRALKPLPWDDTRLRGDLVELQRMRKGWSQVELAARAGLSGNLISEVERGVKTPYWVSVVRIAEALDVSLDYLAGRSAQPETQR